MKTPIHVSLLALGVSLLALGACSSGPPRDVPAGPELGRYTDAHVIEAARSLTTTHGIPEDRRRELLAELDRLLADGDFRAEVQERGITGVFAYSGGSGGLLFSGGSATGVANFAEGGQAVPFEASTVAMGAFAGGTASWGIGVLVGLTHEAWLPGEYDGTAVSSTAGTASLAGARLKSEWHDHSVRIVATGAGLSVGAGHVEITVTALPVARAATAKL